MSPITRLGILKLWNTGYCPARSEYLLDIIHDAEIGRRSPWNHLRIARQFKLIGAGKLRAIPFNQIFEW